MIQLCSKKTMVLGRDGRQRSFDFGQLRRDLLACLRDCGVTEAWIAEHVALTVEEQVARWRVEGTPVLVEPDLDSLVCGALVASGYGDVAAAYQCRCELGSDRPDVGVFSDWDSARLERVLAGLVPLSADACQRLAGEVRGALTELGFRRVTDELLRQVAAHLLEHGRPEGRLEKPAGQLVIAPEGFAPLFSKAQSRLVAAGGVKILPVPGWLPRVRLEVDLPCLVGAASTVERLSELILLPRLHTACRELCAMAIVIREEVCNQKQDAAHHPAHLIVNGMDRLLSECAMPMSSRAERVLVAEVRETLTREVVACVPFELILSVR